MRRQPPLRRLLNNASESLQTLAIGFVIIATFAIISVLNSPRADAQQYPTRNIGTKQVTVASTGTGTQVVPAGAARQSVSIQNHSAIAIYCGPDTTISTSNGYRIIGVDGTILTIATQSPIQCIAASATAVVSVLETY